jgi:hypothetical protein
MANRFDGLTRRGLLTGVAGGAVATLLGARARAAGNGSARIVRVESDRLWQGETRDPRVLNEMLNRGLLAFSGEKNPADAWRHYFTPGMKVGAGAKPADVIVWDRFKDHFASTDFKPGKGPSGESIVVGGDYHPGRTASTSGGPCPIDRIPIERTDVTINLPLLKDHGGAGVTLALKNIAFGAYKHHRGAHEGGCDPYIAEAYAHFVTQAKIPLIILDATRACYDGGPRPSDRNRIWNENAIYLASDPVALDVIGRKLIMAKRVAAGLSDRTRDAKHIESAASKGLGVLDPARIDLITVRA